MRRTGFTALELVIVLSISAVLVPATYAFARVLDDQRAIGVRHLEAADELRSLSDALRADRRSLGFSSRTGLRLEGSGACSPIEYALSPEHTVVRRAPTACGGDTTLATHVTAVARSPGGVALTFAFELRPEQVLKTEVFLAVDD